MAKSKEGCRLAIARHDWEHSIAPGERLRFSITFRSLSTKAAASRIASVSPGATRAMSKSFPKAAISTD
jgi:hypothetical protein